MDHLGIYKNAISPVLVNCDSQAPIAYIKNPKYHGKTKYIDMKYNFVRCMVAHNEVNMKYVSTQKYGSRSFDETYLERSF